MKHLRKRTETLYTWRNLELSRLRPYEWNLAYTGKAMQTLPCGSLSRTFLSLQNAKAYLKGVGFTLED